MGCLVADNTLFLLMSDLALAIMERTLDEEVDETPDLMGTIGSALETGKASEVVGSDATGLGKAAQGH